jgi:hypothetical protein
MWNVDFQISNVELIHSLARDRLTTYFSGGTSLRLGAA